MSNHPKTFKAARLLSAKNDLEFFDKEWQDPKDGEVIVKVKACGVCHSDILGPLLGLPVNIPGHEITGTVAAVPASETEYKVGDKVGAGWHGGHCFKCPSCKTGDFVTCDNEIINGLGHDGGYQEYALLHREAITVLPDGTDLVHDAPLFCAGVTVFNSMRHMKAQAGDTVLIQGIGGLGHLAIQYANKMGFRVAVLSSTANKEKLARDLGAHEYIVTGDKDVTEALKALKHRPTALVVTSTVYHDFAKLTGCLAVGAEVMVLGVPHEPIPANANHLVQKRLTIRGWPSGTPVDSYETIEAAHLYGVKVATEVFPFKDAQKAVDKMLAGHVRFRAVLEFDD